ncbi:MAG: hypothetical protein KJ060_07365 [Candidatus Hydrogenedentes bacterium]|nr:hypothetical protein [Candidatus Hydrogenedentota bacterium]
MRTSFRPRAGAWLVLVLAFPCLAAPYGFLETLGGPPVCRTISGNGRLTIGVDAYGRIAACCWPGPGYANHLNAPTPDGPGEGGHGLVWGIRTGDVVEWLDGSDYEVVAQTVSEGGPFVRTQCTIAGIPGSIVQESFVHSEYDLLVSRVAISTAVDGDLVLLADAAPATAAIPEVPFLEFLRAGATDFASFVEGATVYHVRPAGLTSHDWLAARRWALQHESPTPEALQREGVWIAYRFAAGHSVARCFSNSDMPAGRLPFAFEDLPPSLSVAGDCVSAALPNLETAERERYAVLYLAFGSTRKEVEATLAYAIDTGYASLRAETESAWAPVLAGAALQVSPRFPEFREPLVQALTTISIATSQESGAIIRAPGSQPLLSLDHPRHSVWAGLALDYLGLTEMAERHLSFLLSNVRTTDRPGMPAGSLPAALHGDGSDGLPRVVLDGTSVGWLLWAIDQHAGFLDAEAKGAFLEQTWPMVERLATFLMFRSDPSGATPYSFDPQRLKERDTAEFLIACRLGLSSASVLALETGNERPEWARRVTELERVLKTRALSSDGQWITDDPLPFWAAGILPLDDPRWEIPARNALAKIEGLPLAEGLQTALNLAFIWRDNPRGLEALRDPLRTLLLRPKGARPNDTLDAANTILTTVIACGA